METTAPIPQPRRWSSWQKCKEFLQKFNVGNLLFYYCLPLCYVFYPTLLMPAILLRSLSFVIGWLYGLVLDHHKARPRRKSNYHKSRRNRMPRPTTSSNARASSSSSSASEEEDTMEYWLKRCSICLDKKYAFCLESCRDQFCQPCFERYVSDIVNASWGLGVTRIKCPVCQEAVRQSEWSRHVPPSVVEKYERFNQPYRPFSRYCPTCRSQIAPCPSPRSQGVSRQRRLLQISSDLQLLEQELEGLSELQRIVQQCRHIFHELCQQGATFRVGRIQNLCQDVIPSLAQVAQRHPPVYYRAQSIGKQLIALEVIPDMWKQSQFYFISHFPIETCASCRQDTCLQCGESAHGSLSCTDNFRRKLTRSADSDKATIQWKLDHAQPCPNCSIMINRDEGCHKVDCLFCGYQFCWSCRANWSQRQCGYYQCQATNAGAEVQNGKAERGVPDVDAIHAQRRS